jgi:hypothetical protein
MRNGERPTRCLDTYLEKPRFAQLSKDGQARRWAEEKEIFVAEKRLRDQKIRMFHA